MKKLAKIALITALVMSVGGSALASTFAALTRSAQAELRQHNISEMLSLKSRIRKLESGLSAIADALPDEKEAQGDASQVDASQVDASQVNAEPDDTEVMLPEETVAEAVVTHAEAHAAEPAAERGYIISVYRGIIGVFDADGRLLRTVNVSVATLPASDREALLDGIPASTQEQMLEIVGQYE